MEKSYEALTVAILQRALIALIKVHRRDTVLLR